MKKRTGIGLAILRTAVIIGILADVLLRAKPWGLNVTLFNVAFAAGMVMLLRRTHPEALNRQTFSLVGAWLFFGAMFLWRDSIELRVADTFAIVVILSVLLLPRLNIWPAGAGLFHYVAGFFVSAANAFISPFILLVSDIEWRSSERTGFTRYLYGSLRGVVIAAPLLVIFGALFVAADAAYQGMLEQVLDIKPEVVFSHILLTGGFAWLSAGYLRGALLTGAVFPESKTAAEEVENAVAVEEATFPESLNILDHINRSEEPNPQEPAADEKPKWNWAEVDNSVLPRAFTLGAVEVGVILGLLNLLFLSFVIVQARYLFGGMELIQTTPDFKLAEYARRGFGELVFVAALVLPVLLTGHWLIRKGDATAGKLFKVLAGIQIALLFVIMASAVQRLVLLIGPLGYGLTTVRLYPLIFMSWLAIVFVWFGITVLGGNRKHFAWGALWAAIVILAGTHFLNPDALIARTNLDLMRQGRDFDATYYRELSDDAIPVLVVAVNDVQPADRDLLLDILGHRYCKKTLENDLRSWNYSRVVSSQILLEHENLLIQAMPRCYGDDGEGPLH